MKSISSFFKNNPKKMFLFFAFIFILVALTLAIFVLTSISKINNAYKLNSEVQKTLNLINKADLFKNEFQISGKNENIINIANVVKKHFDSTILKVEFIMKNKISNSIISSEQKEMINQILSNLNLYQTKFHKIIQLNYEKYNSNDGIYVQINTALQLLERSELPINMVPLVMLKRNQKDFEQKRDLIYYQDFKEAATQFLLDVETYEVLPEENNTQKDELIKNLKTYIKSFSRMVAIEKEIGLTDNEGLKKELFFLFQTIENNLILLNNIFETRALSIAQNIKISILILFFIIIISIIIILSYFIKSVYNPILEIQNSAEQIALGELNINFEKIKKNVLLKNIVESFGKMIKKLELTLFQIDEIAKLNLNNKIDLASENDIIGKSVVNVQKQLFKFTEDERLMKEEDEKRNWTTEGLAIFSNYLRGNEDLKTISQTIISKLVKYLKANQGGLYIINSKPDGVKYIDLLACFAYERTKYINKQIEIGEGLVGQCYLERESIYMNDVPQDYIKITSGLGYANPKCILIVPAKINDSIEAIIELASFSEFKPYQIMFVEKLAENIASTIWNIQVNEKTKKLLQESQIKTEEMKSKEEEMQQNIEELASIQEEMTRKEKQFQVKIAELTTLNEEMKRKEKYYISKLEEFAIIYEENKHNHKMTPSEINDINKTFKEIERLNN